MSFTTVAEGIRVQFETVLKPDLAERWRAAASGADETFFDILAARRDDASRPRGVRRWRGPHHLRRAQGQGRALRRLPAAASASSAATSSPSSCRTASPFRSSSSRSS